MLQFLRSLNLLQLPLNIPLVFHFELIGMVPSQVGSFLESKLREVPLESFVGL